MKNMRHMGNFGPKYQRGFWNFIIPAAVSLFGAVSSRDAQKDTQRSSDANQAEANEIRREQLELARNADDRSQQLFDVYTDNYLPAELDFLKDSQEGLSTEQYVGEASADSRLATAKADERSKRRLNSLGIDPNSGKYQGLEHASKVKSAASEAGAMTSARRYVDKENFNRKARAVAIGKGLPGAAAGFADQASSGLNSVGSAYGNDAVRFGDQAQEAGQAYGSAVAGLADSIGSGLDDWWENRNKDLENASNLFDI